MRLKTVETKIKVASIRVNLSNFYGIYHSTLAL